VPLWLCGCVWGCERQGSACCGDRCFPQQRRLQGSGAVLFIHFIPPAVSRAGQPPVARSVASPRVLSRAVLGQGCAPMLVPVEPTSHPHVHMRMAVGTQGVRLWT
jgi:hypothetical protein